MWTFAGRPIEHLLIDYGFSYSPDFGQTLSLLVLYYILWFPTISIGIILFPAALSGECPLILYSTNGAFWGFISFMALRIFGNRRRRRNVKE